MDYTTLSEFLLTILVSNMIAFMIGAIVSPPDPFTQFYYYLPLVPVTVVVSYLLVYRGGFDYIKDRI
jgi:Sec-independent protein secretion pathway component TatC